ncbi:tyrosyl-tRNA synthetase [Gloeophyllum trabeum ATCC 11539]|uniref:Tyrosine--tRNA ligase n=1 Tax=Gloeophyllum trabeum (strain ATCC 11539 / FP-39264 / Madison 617) TaxID=670483 RepID=S7QBB2_GLOTA|nr:tyrosyl-tRNA synthetase [Gloeophyllum trabeum ATCC 11539]EPQ57231.1 tyrosyl-tRNA synthetase [Gloeophyllum trabeum ATCC 11539]
MEVDLLTDVKRRGLVSQISSPELLGQLLREKQTVYMGIDPTAPALHVGHLLPLMCLMHFHVRGHTVHPVIGGATGLVGDPSGRAKARDRDSLANERIEGNARRLADSMGVFFRKGLEYAEGRWKQEGPTIGSPEVLNNLEWTRDLSLLEFLRTVGVHARMNTMLGRESVKLRLSSEEGMSYTEFSYQLLQAYDFYTLFRKRGCRIQIGGSDQWGNILAGQDLIGRLAGPDQAVVCLTTPLFTTSSGEKFGKSAGNAVWLDDSMTSPFDFYQFFTRTTDEDVPKLLKMLTLLPMETIDASLNEHKNTPERRVAQHLLADEVTEMIHGVDGLRQAHAATKALFAKDYTGIKAADVIAALRGDPRLVFSSGSDLFAKPLARLAHEHRLVPSMSAARQLVSSKGFYVNNKRVEEVGFTLRHSDLLDGRLAIVRAGKGNHLIIALSEH